MGETVYVAVNGRKSAIYAEEDCRKLRMSTVTEKERCVLWDDVEECPACFGDEDPATESTEPAHWPARPHGGGSA